MFESKRASRTTLHYSGQIAYQMHKGKQHEWYFPLNNNQKGRPAQGEQH